MTDNRVLPQEYINRTRLSFISFTKPYVRISYTPHVFFTSHHLFGIDKELFALRHEFILMNLNGFS